MKYHFSRKNAPKKNNIHSAKEANRQKSKSRFYQQSWFIILSLFFFAPLGIFLMYRFGKWNKFLKAAAALLSLVWFIFVIFTEYPPAADEALSPDTDYCCTKTYTETQTSESSLREDTPSSEKHSETEASDTEHYDETYAPTAAQSQNTRAPVPSSEKSTASQMQPPHVGMEYVLNTNTKVYHRPDCRYVKTIKGENYMLSSSVPTNYRPCKVCKP